MSRVSTLNIRLYGELIGTITNVGSDRSLFAFTEEYIANQNRPILSLGFKDSLGELITDFKTYQKQLMPFFSNLLPEDAMRKYLAERAGVNPEREFFLLWVLGQDLPGAISVEPADGEMLPPNVHEPLEKHSGRERALRFSLAGVQLKFSAIKQANGGLTVPVDGAGGSWIVKLPWSAHEGVPENEFSMMELARLVGIDVPDNKLIKIEEVENIPAGIERYGNTAFSIKRFDRAEDGSAIHIEDFAQIFGVYPHDKYKRATMRNIANVIGIEGGERDVAELVRRIVFNALIGNADMHLKNWSLIYNDPRIASIAPAYDFVSTIPYIKDNAMALKVSRSKRFDEFSFDELAHMAAKAMLPEKLVLDTARETIALFHEHWAAEKANLPHARSVVDAIDRHMKVLPIAQ